MIVERPCIWASARRQSQPIGCWLNNFEWRLDLDHNNSFHDLSRSSRNPYTLRFFADPERLTVGDAEG
jgi:hypothetical protein